MSIRINRTACAVALSIAFQPVFAASDDETAVVVTATRFATGNPHIPANISVITRRDIETSPAANLPDLLRAQAGINVRTLYGSLGMDATVDLRGFGDAAASNTLILLDGQRINPIDSGAIDWSSIPLEAVSRIEVMRGSGTVLYGDRASGGVINIITDKSSKSVTTVTATLGSYGYHAVDAHLAEESGGSYFNITGHDARASGWRQNSQSDQLSIAGRIGHRFAGGEGFADFASFKESSGTPSSLFSSQYQTHPEMARKLFDHQSKEGYRIRPGFAWNIGATVRLEAELGRSSMDFHGRNFDAARNPKFRSDRTSETVSFTPRLRSSHGLGSLKSESVIGIDYYDGNVSNPSWSSSTGSNTQKVAQQSLAAYFQNVTALADHLDLTVGARDQHMDQRAQDANAGVDGTVSRNQTAWEVGLTARMTDNLKLFGRTGRTFRFANTDELFGFDPNTYATTFAGDLKPQQGKVHELGGTWQADRALVRASVYQINLTDEIAYDDPSGANVNLPATRRQGFEFESQWRIAHALHLRLMYARTAATFRDGNNDGKDIPLVPRDKTSLETSWNGGNAGNWSALVNYVGHQRVSGDTANTRRMLDAYTTVDLRASWDLRPWTVSARIANLFDRRYATSAGYSVFNSDYYYYPAEPRSLFVTASYRFH